MSITTLQILSKKTRSGIEENPREGWNEVNRRKGNKETSHLTHSPSKKKIIENSYRVLTSEDNEDGDTADVEKEKIPDNDPKKDEDMAGISQEYHCVQTLPLQAHIEVISKASMSSGGLITISRAKSQTK